MIFKSKYVDKKFFNKSNRDFFDAGYITKAKQKTDWEKIAKMLEARTKVKTKQLRYAEFVLEKVSSRLMYSQYQDRFIEMENKNETNNNN